MREIASYIKYLVQTSVNAGATRVLVEISEDNVQDTMITRIIDNGWGMTTETLRRILNRFHITGDDGETVYQRSLVAITTNHGSLNINYGTGRGTAFEAVWTNRRLEQPPRGNIAATVAALIINNPSVDCVYSHTVNGNKFWIATNLIAAILSGEPISHPAVKQWLGDYLTKNIAGLYK